MMVLRAFCVASIAALAAIDPASLFAVTAGQVDTFQTGTTAGWTDGHGGDNVANVATGGPAGTGDRYLQVSSGSFDSESHLITFNQSQWLGNYVSTKVVGLKLDLKNFGTASLPIRIAIREGSAGSATPGYSSTTAFTLPNDGQWHKSVFLPLTTSTMTAINGPRPFATDLASVADFRLLSSQAPSTIGDGLSARIGVDNITAVPLGDINLDGSRNKTDAQTLATALSDLNAFKASKPISNSDLLAVGDLNADGKITNADLQSLLTLIKTSGIVGSAAVVSAVPEPSSAVLAATAGMLLGLCMHSRRKSK
jgi:hypothetical protein